MRPGMITEKIIEFWFDFASTYSYPAAMRIEDLAAKSGGRIVWRPFVGKSQIALARQHRARDGARDFRRAVLHRRRRIVLGP